MVTPRSGDGSDEANDDAAHGARDAAFDDLDSGVLVVGAGPAGSAAAAALARLGVPVTLVDRRSFPREKICGDGISPLALEGLARLDAYWDEARAAGVGRTRD